ncbi:type II toxin-antitoxin system VapC family toxin [Lichenihabitans sp. Uapishka_5]|uniref:type II toxin-antitoxin system VapC family toxin n=1 Tax=Lichenihabitans sp. Uapishka_5 TaxID=3037302 RepID=UPI0029E807E0|nr:type II toxin-antitoxin system VapC family toxin [Lichenihabitans sp. Uapishka_5]MDX7953135.1 type II toxin-antitoxin system VapC family toxin [Lichenihabitans sp. Uapishka_5]
MGVERFVLDASALLRLFFQQAGAARVEAVLDRAVMSAVNYAEVVAKLADRGVPMNAVAADLADLDLEIVPVDRALADDAGWIGAGPNRSGLAVTDRCCLALARRLGAVAMTTDRGWPPIGAAIGVAVEVLPDHATG